MGCDCDQWTYTDEHREETRKVGILELLLNLDTFIGLINMTDRDVLISEFCFSPTVAWKWLINNICETEMVDIFHFLGSEGLIKMIGGDVFGWFYMLVVCWNYWIIDWLTIHYVLELLFVKLVVRDLLYAF